MKNLNVDTVDLLLVVGKIFFTAAARWSRHHRQRQVLRRAKAAKNFNFLIFNPAGLNNFAFIYKLIKITFFIFIKRYLSRKVLDARFSLKAFFLERSVERNVKAPSREWKPCLMSSGHICIISYKITQ